MPPAITPLPAGRAAFADPKEKNLSPTAPERPEEFAPDLNPELQTLADALVEVKAKIHAADQSGRSPKN